MCRRDRPVHWLNITSVGGGYAIGTGGLSLTLLCFWTRLRQRAALAARILALRLSGIPAYLARYRAQVTHSAGRRAVAGERLQFPQSLRRTSERDVARGMLEGARVTFYLCADSRMAAWDVTGTEAVLRGGAFALYGPLR